MTRSQRRTAKKPESAPSSTLVIIFVTLLFIVNTAAGLNKKWIDALNCAFITSGFMDNRTWSLLRHRWPKFQIWWRPGKNCGCYRERTEMFADRQTDTHTHAHTQTETQRGRETCTQVILYLSNAMHCTGPTRAVSRFRGFTATSASQLVY